MRQRRPARRLRLIRREVRRIFVQQQTDRCEDRVEVLLQRARGARFVARFHPPDNGFMLPKDPLELTWRAYAKSPDAIKLRLCADDESPNARRSAALGNRAMKLLVQRMETVVIVPLGALPLSCEQCLKSAFEPPIEFPCRLAHHRGFERLTDQQALIDVMQLDRRDKRP